MIWIDLAQDGEKWLSVCQAVVNTLTNFQAVYYVELLE
jgi:hypothetical protein